MSKEIIITCEHAGNDVPELYKSLFESNPAILNTHRGYDIGAYELTQICSQKLEVTPHVHSVTRLLVDLNRSLHSSELFSEYGEPLDEETRKSVVENYYEPHRHGVEKQIAERINEGKQILHLSVHTFTPKLNGTVRDADIGLLYDPSRPSEEEFCEIWRSLLERESDLKIRFNYPYPGIMDGFSTYLRTKYSDPDYAGLEIEVNQKFPESDDNERWLEIQHLVGNTLRETYRIWTE